MSKSKVKTPKYYDGNYNYTAKDVVDNFELNYHLGTACTYILRAYKKHKKPNSDIQKAIDHLTFELEKIQKKESVKNKSQVITAEDRVKELQVNKSK